MTTISNLPKDLVEEILLKVPITCLGAVRSTCKGWNALSKKRILCKAEAKNQFVGFMMKKFKLCSLRFDLHGTFNKIELVNPSIKEIGNNLLNQVKVYKVFHCDGLLICVTKEDKARLLVWNPYLGQTRWIQPRNRYHILDRYAIGYDNNRKHKILRFLNCYVYSSFEQRFQRVLEYEIYDLSSNSWRVLDIITTWEIKFSQRCVSLKGNTYLFATKICEEGGVCQHCLLCFDFTTESFGQFLPLPLEYYLYDTGFLSSIGDEKLAALYQCRDSTEVEIWVTTMIEPNAVSWQSFLKFVMGPHYFRFPYDIGSFFIDEEKKVAVVIRYDEFERGITGHYKDVAYIFRESGNVKKVHLGEAVPHIQGGSLNLNDLLVCCSSYVPSLVQINQISGFKNEREEDEEANQQTKRRRLPLLINQ